MREGASSRTPETSTLKATWKRGFKLPWREAGPPNHDDEKVDSDQWVVNKEVSLDPQKHHPVYDPLEKKFFYNGDDRLGVDDTVLPARV